MFQNKQRGFQLNGIMSMVITVLFFIALFYVAQFVFKILWAISPILFIAALIIDFRGVMNFGKWLINVGKKNLMTGIVAVLLCIIAFPLVALFLLGKALFKRKLKDAQGKYQEADDIPKDAEYIDYEEVVEEEPRMELPPIRPKLKVESKKKNEYDDLFDN